MHLRRKKNESDKENMEITDETTTTSSHCDLINDEILTEEYLEDNVQYYTDKGLNDITNNVCVPDEQYSACGTVHPDRNVVTELSNEVTHDNIRNEFSATCSKYQENVFPISDVLSTVAEAEMPYEFTCNDNRNLAIRTPFTNESSFIEEEYDEELPDLVVEKQSNENEKDSTTPECNSNFRCIVN